MTNHPGIRAALIAAAGTLALLAAACGANGTTASGAQAGPNASTSPTAGAGEGNTGGNTGTGGGTATKSPTPKATTATPKSSPSTASGPQIVTFKVSGNASCYEAGPGFSAPGTVTLTWKVTGATKVALSIDDPTFFGKYNTGSFARGGTDSTTRAFAGCPRTRSSCIPAR